jgi:hypothetical protein
LAPTGGAHRILRSRTRRRITPDLRPPHPTKPRVPFLLPSAIPLRRQRDVPHAVCGARGGSAYDGEGRVTAGAIHARLGPGEEGQGPGHREDAGVHALDDPHVQCRQHPQDPEQGASSSTPSAPWTRCSGGRTSLRHPALASTQLPPQSSSWLFLTGSIVPTA